MDQAIIIAIIAGFFGVITAAVPPLVAKWVGKKRGRPVPGVFTPGRWLPIVAVLFAVAALCTSIWPSRTVRFVITVSTPIEFDAKTAEGVKLVSTTETQTYPIIFDPPLPPGAKIIGMWTSSIDQRGNVSERVIVYPELAGGRPVLRYLHDKSSVPDIGHMKVKVFCAYEVEVKWP